MSVYTTEIASDSISSDNPIHQRLLKAYVVAKDFVKGDVLEVGVGEGRGVEMLMPGCDTFTGIDKIDEVIQDLSGKYPQGIFKQMNIPPFDGLASNKYDSVISFQVIEHIKNDLGYLKEIHRVLKPGGKALITTPNIKKTLTRNPWHIREYTASELKRLCHKVFDQVEMKGIAGNEKVMEYYEMNKKSVEKIIRWDIFNLQYRLPAAVLRVPYDLLNRMNRNKLEGSKNDLVSSIDHSDYLFSDSAESSLDLFAVLTK
ncbi:MAG TPA: SAM-dependent methyltransferase [Cytophagales bacterium]|jgi:2-polyprenyl-3-methyl-5-hydroxy-6-metoxy-1,4-benzoquinol methylase|nr:SAM-dependent methyltransferase [Cytophagales bacterium]